MLVRGGLVGILYRGDVLLARVDIRGCEGCRSRVQALSTGSLVWASVQALVSADAVFEVISVTVTPRIRSLR